MTCKHRITAGGGLDQFRHTHRRAFALEHGDVRVLFSQAKQARVRQRNIHVHRVVLHRHRDIHGIGDRTRVIVIPHDGALQSATRVFITLAYLGAMDRISLMNGSYQAWKSESRTVTTAAPAAAPAVTFTPKLRPDIIATIAQVEAATKDSTRHIIDARLTRFYNGDGGGYPRPGHIPTAVNVPLSSVSTNGYVKPISELKTLFAEAGVDQSKPVITYCHIGQQATLVWFVATMLGHDARMFDGSFQEWSGTARLPVVGPPGK